MEWSLYRDKEYLPPLAFSNDKTQLDIVEEVIEAIKHHKIIFIKGVCGSGKSAIALNIAKEFKKTSIVVPIKTLQRQYKDDYTKNMKVGNLKITVIDGRNNHKCPYKNTKCDDKQLPCTIEIKEENINQIKEYMEQNPLTNETIKEKERTLHNYDKEAIDIKEVRRRSIAPACPHWSPIIPKEVNYKLDDAKKIEYPAINNRTFVYYKRKDGCPYYDQFISYKDSDVIVFNSKKYELETLMDRKPETDIEIIDECDEFLDSLSAEKEINLNRMHRKLQNIEDRELVEEITNLTKEIFPNEDIELLKDTKVINLLRYFLKNKELIEELEEDDYLYDIYETAKIFEKFFDETYISFKTNKYRDTIVTLTMINLEKKLKEYLDKNKVFIMMSGTIHSEMVLKNIFGIKEFKIIEAETQFLGKLTRNGTGLEKAFNHKFLQQPGSREIYLKALEESIEVAERPLLIHVNSYNDLPSEEEAKKYNLFIKTREKFKEENQERLLKKFKNKEIDTLYSTKCSRGIDLPGAVCNSILFTKYPYPSVTSLFWQILRKSRPEHFNMFYFDKARRELIQRIYRGLRSEDDEVQLLSPDIRVFNI